MVCSSLTTRSPADLPKSFPVVRSSAYHGEDGGAGRSLSVNWGAATGRDRDSILHRMVALRVPRGVEDEPAMDAQWFEHFRASATAMEPTGWG